MKKLLLIAFTALAVQAQSTNTLLSLRATFTDEAGATNNTTLNVSAREADGVKINYAKDVMVAQQQTNPVPSFQNSLRGLINTAFLREMARQSAANELKTNRLDTFAANLGALIDNNVLTAQQLNDIRAIAKSTNVTAALP